MSARPSWRDRAACANSSYDWTIEPTESIGREEVLDTRVACAFICAGCPVNIECRAAAEDDRLAPALPGETVVRPFGILAGQFYDGRGRPPQPPAQSSTAPVRAGHDSMPLEQKKTLLRTLFDLGHDDQEIASRLTLRPYAVEQLRAELGLVRKSGPKGDGLCGTPGGARAHIRRGEPRCVECESAYKASERERNARARQARKAREAA